MSKNYPLLEIVIGNSEQKYWEMAVLEWEIYDVEEDKNSASTCICGKENIKYLFTIHNEKNGNILKPIGSSCINKFKRKELNETVNVNEKLFKLLHALEDGEYIELNSKYFSRSLLKYLYNDECFNDNEYNTAEEGYAFMLKMFNKRNDPTSGQESKIKAIIMNEIRPYLERRLAGKVK